MKIGTWLALMLLVFLMGCGGNGGGSYEYQYPYGARPVEPDPWNYPFSTPPMQNSPEVQGSLSGDHNPVMSQWLHPREVNPDGVG